VIRWKGGEVHVEDASQQNAQHVHQVLGEPPAEGTSVTCELDWERRYRLMRTHTALHALSGIVFRGYGAKVTGGHMEPGMARMDLSFRRSVPSSATR
jgi:misacylated tRNA(Ala) deacylase